METWFLNHALGLSLSVLLLGLPGPLGAGTPAGDNNSTDPVTAGIDFSTATRELGDLESHATSTSHSGESSSPSRRDILPTHTADRTHAAAGTNPDTELTQSFTETSSGSPEALRLYTEPLTSALVVTTEASSSSRGLKGFVVNTDQVSDASPVVSWAASSFLMLTEEARMPQDSLETTLRHGEASPSMPHTAVHTDSTSTSTAISRAGERTLLSVTSSSSGNSTSPAFFTNHSNSHQPPSTWGVPARTTETEDYTHSAPSSRSDSRDTTDQHMTHSIKGVPSETGSPEWPRGSSSGQPNATQHQRTSTSEGTSESTPPLRVTELSTDRSEADISSTPPGTSPAEGPMHVSGTGQEMGSSVPTSTESSTGVHSASTQNPGGPEEVSSRTTEQSVALGPTTGLPTVISRTSEQTDSPTDPPVLLTEASLATTPVTVTERPHITEENTFKDTVSATDTIATSATSATSPLAETSSYQFSGMTSSSVLGPPTEATTLYAAPSTTSTNLATRTSPMVPTHSTLSSQTRRPSAGTADPTNVTTLQVETSKGTLGNPTAHSQPMATTYPQSTPAKSTETLQTTWKKIDRGRTTAQETTISPTGMRSTMAPLLPRNPCASNPCMNGGMCASDRGHPFTCHCQQAWTGPTCNQDMDECERDPCPVGSRCVNTRGSFSCECPLGFNLEDGRTCTRAKTFLGTFSVNRLPHDSVVFKSTTVYEIQREIIQLLNASLSVLRGYSRSLLSKKEEDGVRISAVHMFSISTDVTSTEVYNSIQMSLSNCSSSLTHCLMVLHHRLTYHVDSLCVAQKTQCDAERSACTDNSGTAHCQCLQGYYKHNPDDLSCLECGDGYKLENGTCVQCMFGFGGFNCGNFYKLIAVVVSPAGGALLLILIIALIVTCCKKDKNDINKIIFKSGDLQMSPYADFPKSNRISMEWGRETIEMQENGSTKNLLHMTDIYYSPALRNSDLERNSLYPFPGLPGSRHSCIYPAQWNPSFISDDSRRRDYF